MVTRIDRVHLRELLAAGASLVEVLPEEEYGEEHLPGAVNIPLKSFDRASVGSFDGTRPIIVYCQDTL